MKIIDKALNVILSLVMIGISLLGIIVALDLFRVADNLIELLPRMAGQMEVGIIWLVLFLFSLRIFIMMFEGSIKDTTVNHGELGDVKITLTAINKLVRSLVQEELKVTKLKSNVKANSSDGVLITLNLTVPFGTNIAELTSFLQQKIKSQVTESTGAEVEEIKILVEEISKEENEIEVEEN